ncbi:MAG: metallopeptidase family protein [Pseudomonadota bacterium]
MAEDFAPSAEQMMAIAQETFEGLPAQIRAAAGRVNTRVEEFAERAILDDFGMEDPFQLTGLYQGIPLIDDSVTFPSAEAPLIFLYRQPILAEWCARGDVGFRELVAHVFIHELGHHFGWSDEEMHELAGH